MNETNMSFSSGGTIFTTGTRKTSNSILVVLVCLSMLNSFDHYTHLCFLIRVEFSHRFMGTGEGTKEMPDHLLDDLRKRSIYYKSATPENIKVPKPRSASIPSKKSCFEYARLVDTPYIMVVCAHAEILSHVLSTVRSFPVTNLVDPPRPRQQVNPPRQPPHLIGPPLPSRQVNPPPRQPLRFGKKSKAK